MVNNIEGERVNNSLAFFFSMNEFWHGVIVGVFIALATLGVGMVMIGVWIKSLERAEAKAAERAAQKSLNGRKANDKFE